MHQQLAVKLNGLPIQLVLISPSGHVGFTKLADKFPIIFDDGNNVIISDGCILVYDETIRYNVATKLTDRLKAWLMSLELEQPY